MNDKVNANFKVDADLWKRFLVVVKSNNSDASKTLRVFIENYLKYNENLKND